MFVQNFIKLSASVHELSGPQDFLPYLAMVKNPITRSCDLDLWPMTLKINRFCTCGWQDTCSCKISSSYISAAVHIWVILRSLQRKKLRRKHNCPPSLPRTVIIWSMWCCHRSSHSDNLMDYYGRLRQRYLAVIQFMKVQFLRSFGHVKTCCFIQNRFGFNGTLKIYFKT